MICVFSLENIIKVSKGSTQKNPASCIYTHTHICGGFVPVTAMLAMPGLHPLDKDKWCSFLCFCKCALTVHNLDNTAKLEYNVK